MVQKEKPKIEEKKINFNGALKILKNYKEQDAELVSKALTIFRKEIQKRLAGLPLEKKVLEEYRNVITPISKDGELSQRTRANAKVILFALNEAAKKKGERKIGEVVPRIRADAIDPADKYGLRSGGTVVDYKMVKDIIPQVATLERIVHSQTKEEEVITYIPPGWEIFSNFMEDDQREGIAQALVEMAHGHSSKENGQKIAGVLGNSPALKAQMGEHFDAFIDALEKGDFATAKEELEAATGEDKHPLKSYIGTTLDEGSVTVFEPDKNKMVIYRWGVGVDFEFQEQYKKMMNTLFSRNYRDGAWFAFLNVAMAYTDALLTYPIDKTVYEAGKEPVTTKGYDRKYKWPRKEWYDKVRVVMKAAAGGKDFGLVFGVTADSKEQSLTISPLIKRKKGGVGIPELGRVVGFDGITVKHGFTGEEHYWDLVFHLGKEIALKGRFLKMKAGLAWGILQNGVDGRVTLSSAPGGGVNMSISGELGGSSKYTGLGELLDTYKDFGPHTGATAAIEFPLSKSKKVKGKFESAYMYHWKGPEANMPKHSATGMLWLLFKL